MAISRSEGVVILQLFQRFIGHLPFRFVRPRFFVRFCSSSSSASKRRKFSSQNSRYLSSHSLGLCERRGLEPARTPLGVAALPDETRAFEHLQVLGDCRLLTANGSASSVDPTLALGQPGENRAPGGIGERREGRVQAGRETDELEAVSLRSNRFASISRPDAGSSRALRD